MPLARRKIVSSRELIRSRPQLLWTTTAPAALQKPQKCSIPSHEMRQNIGFSAENRGQTRFLEHFLQGNGVESSVVFASNLYGRNVAYCAAGDGVRVRS
jgi:hypothetical protein